MSKRKKSSGGGEWAGTFGRFLLLALVIMVVVSILTATPASGDRSNPCPDYAVVVSNYDTCWGIDAGRAIKPFVDSVLGGD